MRQEERNGRPHFRLPRQVGSFRLLRAARNVLLDLAPVVGDLVLEILDQHVVAGTVFERGLNPPSFRQTPPNTAPTYLCVGAPKSAPPFLLPPGWKLSSWKGVSAQVLVAMAGVRVRGGEER